MSAEPKGLVGLLVDRSQGCASVQNHAAWATSALAAGFDSPSLRVLAGLDLTPTSLFEVDPVFVRAARELGVDPEPDISWLLKRYELELASRVLDGALGSHEALTMIHEKLIEPQRHRWELSPWCLLWEGNDPYDVGADPDENALHLLTIRYAKEVVDSGFEPTPLACQLQQGHPNAATVRAKPSIGARLRAFARSGRWQ